VKLQQAYYTSTDAGPRAAKGFQFQAWSQGLTPSTLQELERRGGYVPPLSAPTRPGPEELERFPVTLLFQKLSDGGAVVAQSRYLGTDFSGRYGNFLTHSLVLTEPEALSVPPICLWESVGWARSESPTHDLPETDWPEAGGVVTPASVEQFLRANPVRMGRVGNFLEAVQLALREGRRLVVVEDSSRAVACWIGLASFCLGPRWYRRLTFSTYDRNVYHCDALLVGTTAGSDFSFSAQELHFQYSVFDHVQGRFSPELPGTGWGRGVQQALESGCLLSDLTSWAAHRDLELNEMAVGLEFWLLGRGLSCQPGLSKEVLAWCGRHLDSLDPQELTLSCAALLGRSTAGEVVQAATDLYRTAVQVAPGQASEAVQKLYVEWLWAAGLGELEPTTLLQLAHGLPAPGRVEVNLPEPFAGPLPRQLAELRLREWLGQVSLDHAYQLGCQQLGPALVAVELQRMLCELLDSSVGRQLLCGVGAFLEECPQNLSALASWLRQPQIAPLLEQESQRYPWPCLGVFLRARRSFSEAMRWLRTLNRLDTHPELAVMAWEWAWMDPPGCEAALEVIGVLAPAEAELLWPRLLQCLLVDLDLRTVEPSRLQLAGWLTRQPLTQSQRSQVEAVRLAGAFRPTRQPGPDFERILQVVSQLSDPHAEVMLELLGEALVQSDNARQQRWGSRKALEAAGERFLKAYTLALLRSLGGRDRDRPGRAARLFQVWAGPLPESGQPDHIFLCQIFPEVFKTLTPAELDRVAEWLNPPNRCFWAQWRERYSRSGWLRRVVAWLGKGSR